MPARPANWKDGLQGRVLSALKEGPCSMRDLCELGGGVKSPESSIRGAIHHLRDRGYPIRGTRDPNDPRRLIYYHARFAGPAGAEDALLRKLAEQPTPLRDLAASLGRTPKAIERAIGRLREAGVRIVLTADPDPKHPHASLYQAIA